MMASYSSPDCQFKSGQMSQTGPTQIAGDPAHGNRRGSATHELYHASFSSATSQRPSPRARHTSELGRTRHRSELRSGWTPDEILEVSHVTDRPATNVIDLTTCDELDERLGIVRDPSTSSPSELGTTHTATVTLSSDHFGKAQELRSFYMLPDFLPSGDIEILYFLGDEAPRYSTQPPRQDLPVNLSWLNPNSTGGEVDSLSAKQQPSLEPIFLGQSAFTPCQSGVESPRLIARPTFNKNLRHWDQIYYDRDLAIVSSPAAGSPIATPDSGYASVVSRPSSYASSIGDSSRISPDTFEICFTSETNEAYDLSGTAEAITFPNPDAQPAAKRKRRRQPNRSGNRIPNRQPKKRKHMPTPEPTDESPVESESESGASHFRPPISSNSGNDIVSSHEKSDHISAPRDDVSTSEDENQYTSSREPTPWPESWYDGGMELGLPRFAARVMAEPFNHDVNDLNGNSPHGMEAIQAASSCCGAGGGNRESDMNRTDVNPNQASGLPGQLPWSSDKTLNGWGGGDDHGGESPDPKRQRMMGPPEEMISRGPFYACPYQKGRPNESPFCGMPHGSRRVHGWTTISRVKQHLLESHGRDHHCSNCAKAYKKVDDAKNCHQKRNCLKRPSPPKLWLSETEAAQLKAERLPSKSDDTWYRMFGLLFPAMEENGPDGYRAKYTPYYSKVDYPSQPHFPPPPNSMWTPGSNSTNSSGLTPPETNGSSSPTNDSVSNAASGGDWQGGGPLANRSFEEQLLGDTDLPLLDFDQVLSQPVFTPDTFTGSHAPVGSGSFEILNTFSGNNPSPAQGETPHATGGTEPSCSCTPSRKCSACRLKQRNFDLRANNETLRTMVVEIRAAMERHNDFLMDVDEQKLLSDEVMSKLWKYQDDLGKLLGSQK